MSMSTLLALESSATACTVALSVAGTCYCRESLTPREHTRLLLPMVDEVLEEAGIEIHQLDALAFSAGPGSFTGLRIAFGLVQGLAFARDIPVVPVPTLAALAEAARQQHQLQPGDHVLPALDARKDEVYWGLYRVDDHHRLIEQAVNRVSAAADVCVSVPVALGVGDGWLFADEMPARPQRTDVATMATASAVLALAEAAFQQGGAIPVTEAELTYLRDEVAWKKRERLQP